MFLYNNHGSLHPVIIGFLSTFFYRIDYRCHVTQIHRSTIAYTHYALEEGQGTVGTRLDVSHDSATPVGMQVWAEAEVTAVDGRKLTFAVTAYDEAGPIGKGTHERFIIQNDKFLAKAQGKKKGN